MAGEQGLVPGLGFVNETDSKQNLVPGAGLLNEGVSGIVYQYAYPISDIATNSWAPSTGATLYGVLDETVADDGDYIYSPDNPTTQQFEVRLTSLGDPLSSSNHTITVRLQASGSDTNFDLDLVQNTTILDSWTENVTVAAGVVERSRTLSGAVADSITDYTDLRIRGIARGDLSFDYWLGGRPMGVLTKRTGTADYWLGGRPLIEKP